MSTISRRKCMEYIKEEGFTGAQQSHIRDQQSRMLLPEGAERTLQARGYCQGPVQKKMLRCRCKFSAAKRSQDQCGGEERVGGKTDGSANCQLSATNQNTRRQFLQTHRCVNVINYCRKPSSAAINSLLRTADGLSLKLWRFELWQPRLYHPKIWLWHSWYLELLFGSLCNVLTWLLWFDFNETAETCNFQSLSQNLLELK